MTDATDKALIELRDKVKAGDRPAFEIGSLAANVWKPESAYGLCTFMIVERAYLGSLDAAEVLHEAVLPGWVYNIAPGFAHVIPPHDNGDQEAHTGLSETVARAWLLAVLEALIAQEPDT